MSNRKTKYIERNCEIIEEFYFAHLEIKTKINRIYNAPYSGSVLWDLGSENVKKSQSTVGLYLWGTCGNSQGRNTENS